MVGGTTRSVHRRRSRPDDARGGGPARERLVVAHEGEEAVPHPGSVLHGVPAPAVVRRRLEPVGGDVAHQMLEVQQVAVTACGPVVTNTGLGTILESFTADPAQATYAGR